MLGGTALEVAVDILLLTLLGDALVAKGRRQMRVGSDDLARLAGVALDCSHLDEKIRHRRSV